MPQEPEELNTKDEEKTALAPNPSSLKQDMPLAKFTDNESTTPRQESQRGRPVLLVGLVLVLAVSSTIFGTMSYRNHTNQVHTDTAAKLNPYLPHTGVLVLSDLMSDNSKGYRWAERSSACQFSGGAYHISEAQQKTSHFCSAHSLSVSDFAFEVQMTIIKGDCGGMSFRVDLAKHNSYTLQVCPDGHYRLLLYVNGSARKVVIPSGSSAAIRIGLQQTNLIAIVATGPDFNLYINHQFVTKGSDDAYTLRSGLIGVNADANSNPTEVAYRDARVWRL